jgi:hypothetical protein
MLGMLRVAAARWGASQRPAAAAPQRHPCPVPQRARVQQRTHAHLVLGQQQLLYGAEVPSKQQQPNQRGLHVVLCELRCCRRLVRLHCRRRRVAFSNYVLSVVSEMG